MSAEDVVAWPKIGDGEQVFPEMKGYRMACCDCGLIHKMDFKVVEVVSNTDDGETATVPPDNEAALRVVLTAYRDEVATMHKRAENTGDTINYLDGLLQAQAKLMFARDRYDEKEAEVFGVALMDFLRLHGMTLRNSLSDLLEAQARYERLRGMVEGLADDMRNAMAHDEHGSSISEQTIVEWEEQLRILLADGGEANDNEESK